MNSGVETLDHSRLLPLVDCDHKLLQIRKYSEDTGTISTLPASCPSAFAPLLALATSSQSSQTSSCTTASASPCLRSEIASAAREEWNVARPSDRAEGQPHSTENEARMNFVPSIAQPQSRWAQKEPEEVKPARRGQERPRGRNSRIRHLRDKAKAAAKIDRRAKKYARRKARAAEVDRAQRLWLEVRRRRARVPFKPAVPYNPEGTHSKSAPDQRLETDPGRLPGQDGSEKTGQTVVPHKPAVHHNPAILYKPTGSGAKSVPGQQLVVVPRGLPRQDLSEGTDETVVPSKPVVPAILYKPPGSGAKSAPGQRLVIVPRRLPRQDLSDETNEDDWSDVDETMSSVTSENLEEEQDRRLQHELSDEETMQEDLSWSNGHESMRIEFEQDQEYDESQFELAQDFYDLDNESGLKLGEETEEEDWSNINPETLLSPGIY